MRRKLSHGVIHQSTFESPRVQIHHAKAVPGCSADKCDGNSTNFTRKKLFQVLKSVCAVLATSILKVCPDFFDEIQFAMKLWEVNDLTTSFFDNNTQPFFFFEKIWLVIEAILGAALIVYI